MVKKICFVVTAPQVIKSFYKGKIKYLIDNGFDVTFVAPRGEEHEVITSEGGRSVCIDMAREPSVLKDIVSLFKLWIFFIFNRFDIVSVSTPKASLLGMLAAKMGLQKRVVYLIRGRAYENMVGLKRKLYSLLDWLVCRLSTITVSVSSELSDKYVTEGLCNIKKMKVLGKGSCTGVDLERFNPDNYSFDFKANKRNELGISKGAYVFLYCGRICREKGVNELLLAYQKFLTEYPDKEVNLLLVGRHEFERDPINKELYEYSLAEDSIINIGWSQVVEEYMAISDVLLFPSYREGFGNIAIEASAMKLPIISTDVIGCRESVKHLNTGILVSVKNEMELLQAMIMLYENEDLRKSLGSTGRARVEQYFSTSVVWSNMLDFYKKLS